MDRWTDRAIERYDLLRESHALALQSPIYRTGAGAQQARSADEFKNKHINKTEMAVWGWGSAVGVRHVRCSAQPGVLIRSATAWDVVRSDPFPSYSPNERPRAE